MKRITLDSRGYTLLEMLLVLFILTIISSIVLQFSNEFAEKQKVESFIQQVQFDIQTIQALTIEQGRVITIEFNDKQSYYAYYDRSGQRIIDRPYPANIEFSPFSTVKLIRIFNGEINDFGKLKFITPLGEKQIIINIHKGRMKLAEL